MILTLSILFALLFVVFRTEADAEAHDRSFDKEKRFCEAGFLNIALIKRKNGS